MNLLAPEFFLGGMLLVTLITAAYSRRLPRVVSLVAVLGALILVGVNFYATADGILFQALSVTPFVRFFDLLVLTSGLLFWMLLPRTAPREVDVLFLATLLGMLLLSKAVDLVAAFFSLELVTFGFYFLVGYLRADGRSTESAVKYFLLGAFSSALMGLGLALLFFLTRTTFLPDILRLASPSPLLTAALVFLGAGLFFKIAAFPFQFWTPDVYAGAPTPVVAFLNAAPKAVGFLLLVRVFLSLSESPFWKEALPWLAVVTMFWGNWVALRQRELKRMLAYSTIAHVGYLLLALLVAPPEAGLRALGFYLATYMLMNFGVFGSLLALSPHPTLEDVRGLARRHPYLALGLLLFLASLAGIPGTAGFAAKALLLFEVFRSGHTLLGIVALGNGVISAYYYLRPVAEMFMEETGETTASYAPLPMSVVQVMALSVIYLGLYPFPLLYLVERALAG